MPEPEYPVKKSMPEAWLKVPLLWNIAGIFALEPCHHKPVIKHMV